jgi:hypothetical protein
MATSRNRAFPAEILSGEAMMTKRIGLAAFGLMLGLSFTAARADDAKVENPMCTAWNKCDAGTSVTMEADFDPGNGQKVHMTGTDTLKEKTADGVKVDSVADVAGDKHEDSHTYPAKVDAADCTDTGKTEDVKAMDKTFKCKVYEMSGACVGQPGETKATVYMSDEMPGGAVKVVLHLGDKEIVMMVTGTKNK